MIEVVRAGLIANSAFTTKLGGQKVYFEEAPQGTTMPYVILTQGSSNPNDTKHTTSDFDQNMVQVFYYASVRNDTATQVGSRTLSDLGRTALDHVNVSYGGRTHFVRYDNRSSFMDEIENKKVLVVEDIFEVYFNN